MIKKKRYCVPHLLRNTNKNITIDSKEFWAWSWAEMGIYDDVANIQMMKERSDFDKVYYVGYSQGTIQMFYALSHREEEILADSLYRFIALAPCTLSPEFGRE